MKRSAKHTVVAALLAVAVVLTLSAPAAVASSLVECVDTVAMDMDQCETTPEPCCCETHSDGATDEMMSGALQPADESAPDSMPACDCSLSSSEPAPIAPAAVPALGTSPVVVAAHNACPVSEFAPLRAHESIVESGPAPPHKGIYLSHCALLR